MTISGNGIVPILAKKKQDYFDQNLNKIIISTRMSFSWNQNNARALWECSNTAVAVLSSTNE